MEQPLSKGRIMDYSIILIMLLMMALCATAILIEMRYNGCIIQLNELRRNATNSFYINMSKGVFI